MVSHPWRLGKVPFSMMDRCACVRGHVYVSVCVVSVCVLSLPFSSWVYAHVYPRCTVLSGCVNMCADDILGVSGASSLLLACVGTFIPTPAHSLPGVVILDE